MSFAELAGKRADGQAKELVMWEVQALGASGESVSERVNGRIKREEEGTGYQALLPQFRFLPSTALRVGSAEPVRGTLYHERSNDRASICAHRREQVCTTKSACEASNK